ncbi:MAG: transglycosylase SLT domain-containing protein [Dehalococcoidia bacterium]
MTLTFPIGPIQTPCPEGGSCGIEWSAIARWAKVIEAAAAEFDVPAPRIAATIVIESRGNRNAIQRNAQGDSFGLMQVVPRFWEGLIEQLAGQRFPNENAAGQAMIDAPSLAVRVGAAVLRSFYDEVQDWDKASSMFFLGRPKVPGVYWDGWDTENGNSGPAYRASLNGLMEELTVTDAPDLVFKTLRPPAYITRIVPKPWEGAGFDRVPPRNNVGMCMHKWWGYGDELSLYRLFGTGGERQADALTDWSITQEGVVTLLNEPWGTRAGWANGPANHLEGDGVQFVRQLGVGAVNSRLVSVEFEGKDEPLTEQQMEKGSSLWAYYYDAWEVPYTQYPLNPKVGLVTDLDHWEIGDKECPFAGARAQRSQFQDRVRGKLKAAQTQGGTTDPIPPVIPPEPDHSWIPDGMTEDVVRGLFGTLERIDMDGTTTNVGFDPAGVISNAWLARGADLKMYPEGQRWFRLQDGATVRNIVSFSNGWLLLGNDGDRSSWKWL